ncbi:hypothetical protein [Acinetobacter haemolyticus]|nr:hypothetical protein [Acinetobacter haemolyticus]
MYEQEYMPTILQLISDETKESLLKDFKFATDYYKKKLEIVCG